MSGIKDEFNNIIETLISVFTVKDSTLKVLLVRKKKDPYKGYWILPGNIVKKNEVLDTNIDDALYNRVGVTNIYKKQRYTFSELNRDPEQRVMAVSYIGLIDTITFELKKEPRDTEYEWFKIDALPKMAYDHEKIVKDAIDSLKVELINVKILKKLFPSDFTLPEVQRVFEQILNKKLDRRNFRKKFISLGLIEDTGYKNDGFNGRPAKLYCFKDEDIEKKLF